MISAEKPTRKRRKTQPRTKIIFLKGSFGDTADKNKFAGLNDDLRPMKHEVLGLLVV